MPSNFIYDAVRADVEQGKRDGRVQTRFPPEPNGYQHIGHAKAIVVDFGVAADFGGICLLRLDDTNPETEETSFVEAIIDDIQWLGYEPADVRYASDYFGQLYEWAEQLVQRGLAYVDDQDGDAISAGRGGFGQPGVNSPYRDRSVEENLRLFRRMRAGEFAEGSHVLRAKIDMSHENMQMRDPVMYRIRKVAHHRTGDEWPIYPNYDWAHGQSDAIEGTTHSICTLEFESHRPLYDWFLQQLGVEDAPRQYEFARLELTHTVTSKRRLAKLVMDGVVDGWDDARMPTLQGLRRRGYPASAIRAFCREVGTTRTNSRQSIESLESYVRRDLNATAQRRMAVLNPLKLRITNWPVDDQGEPVVEHFELTNNPERADDGTRHVAFSGELWIEQDDFREVPPPKYFRLSPGREVRLRGAYFVTATDVVKNDDGEVIEVLATYDPESKGGNSPDGRKVKSTMHWVSAAHGVPIRAALYERLFTAEAPGERTGEALDDLHPDSRTIAEGWAEEALAGAQAGEVVQFERIGYFAADLDAEMLFHHTVGLRDEWAAIQRRG